MKIPIAITTAATLIGKDSDKCLFSLTSSLFLTLRELANSVEEDDPTSRDSHAEATAPECSFTPSKLRGVFANRPNGLSRVPVSPKASHNGVNHVATFLGDKVCLGNGIDCFVGSNGFVLFGHVGHITPSGYVSPCTNRSSTRYALHMKLGSYPWSEGHCLLEGGKWHFVDRATGGRTLIEHEALVLDSDHLEHLVKLALKQRELAGMN